MAEFVPRATYVVANLKETQLGALHPGMRVDVEVDAYPHRTFEGRLESVGVGTEARFALLPADNASGNFVKVVQRVTSRVTLIDVPADIDLLPGLSVNASVHLR